MKKEWQEIINRYTDEYGIVDWERVSGCEKLSEDFIREFKDEVDWWNISRYQKLNEDLIREFKDKVNWVKTSIYQKLSEDFIREFKDKVSWYCISEYQRLSEDFIREFKDKVDWDNISEYQKLSEDFIREFKDRVDLDLISKYQKLSEDFIREFKDRVDWDCISEFQKLSKDFIKEFKTKLDENEIGSSWHYKSTDYKKQRVISSDKYECYDDYFIGYKSIRKDRYSHFNFQYQYLKGNTYECFADASDLENSFGLSVWTKEEAEKYKKGGLVVRCKVYYKDVARIVHDTNKVRCFKIEILD